MRNGVSESIAGFTVPLCATIHMSGSMMKITSCALAICLMEGMGHDTLTFINFAPHLTPLISHLLPLTSHPLPLT